MKRIKKVKVDNYIVNLDEQMLLVLKGFGMKAATRIPAVATAKTLRALLRNRNKVTAQGFLRLVANHRWQPAKTDDELKADFVICLDDDGDIDTISPCCWRGKDTY